MYKYSYPNSLPSVNPKFFNWLITSSKSKFENDVALVKIPFNKHNFETIDSYNYPKIIRVGIECGFIIISGETPLLSYGISSGLFTSPMIPLHPALDENLSPTITDLVTLYLTFLNILP